MNKLRVTRWLSAGLVLGSIGCSDAADPAEERGPSDPPKMGTSPSTTDPKPGDKPPPSTATPGDPQIPVRTVLASLSAAADCDDLLMRVQDDAIAKLMMTVEQYKKQPIAKPIPGRPGLWFDAGVALPESPPTDLASDPSTPSKSPSAPVSGNDVGSGGASRDESAKDPIGASETNNQVAGIDEADFVKVVEKGKSIFLLHGNTLRKLDSWPAAQTKLVGKPLTIEGTPSEMFVTDHGKAVVFSTVYAYQSTGPGK
ncbi:MAG TPA: beta-propeller domain-containing protein, partial [Polyangiales bacterium]